MLSPDAREDQTPAATLPDGRVVNLHDVFWKSGVYQFSTLEPVWQVDWFSQQRDLLYSDDLRHVVWLNRHGFRSTWAIRFYDDGKLVRTYNCASLLTAMNRDWCLPFTSWDWHTQWYGAFCLDARRQSALLSTARRQMHVMGHEIDLGRQEFYTFDLASGNVVDRRSTGAWLVWAYGAALSSLLVVLLLAVRSIGRRIRAPRWRCGFPVA